MLGIFDQQSQQSPQQKKQRRTMGKYIPLIRDNNRGVNHCLTLGPNYICFISCFGAVNLLSIFLLLRLNSSIEGKLYYLVYLVILIYLDITWLACALVNPGIATQQDQRSYDRCEECYIKHNLIIKKKEGRFHCKKCGVCINNHKYHCSISGNCIGKYNFVASYFMLLGILLWVIDLAATLPFAYYL